MHSLQCRVQVSPALKPGATGEPPPPLLCRRPLTTCVIGYRLAACAAEIPPRTVPLFVGGTILPVGPRSGSGGARAQRGPWVAAPG